MNFLGGNEPLDLGQVQNSKFKHAPFQKARYPRKKSNMTLLFFQIDGNIKMND